MPSVPLPSVDDALLRAKQAIAENQRCIGFYGMPGSGKTTAVDRLAAEYSNHLRLRVPRDDDGAVAAIVSLAAQLPEASALDVVKDVSRTYSQRLTDLLHLVPQDTALFFDEPPLTLGVAPGDETIFSMRAREFSARLLKLDLRLKVFTTGAPAPDYALLDAYLVEVKRQAEPQTVIDLAGIHSLDAQTLVAQNATLLSDRSPIEIRLAAWVAGRVNSGALKKTGFRLRELVSLASRHVTSGVRLMLARLALVREPLISEWVVNWAAEGVKLEERALVERVFLFGDVTPRLHGSLAALANAEGWLWGTKRLVAHRSLADQYKARFGASSAQLALGEALKAEIEVVHHRTLGGDASVLDDALYFAEQYDVLGRAFGQQGERLLLRGSKAPGKASIHSAITAYEHALSNDAHDWYAAHYLAFNHDVLGADVQLIERLYREAIELRPNFVWGHSRWIRFLINCGRHDEAAAAFETALDQCVGNTGPHFYEELHLDVARQYLQFGAYSKARAGLERVPVAVRAQLSRYEPLLRYAEWQAEPDRNELVFPPSLSLDERQAATFLQPGEQAEDFMPGRLASITGPHHRFRVKLSSGLFGWRDETVASLKKLGLERWLPLRVGVFVEFLKVKKDSKVVERASVHATRDPFKELEVRFPQPERFLDA